VGQKERERQEWNSLLEKAALTGTALEINAQPRKSDFYDDIVRKAVEKGVLIVIGSCARSLRQYEYMQMGVMKARRGWGSVENVLNAQHWDQIKAIRKSERISKDNTGLKTDHYKKNIADIDGVDATDSVRKQNK
jgi:DNA polymerase (family 10)